MTEMENRNDKIEGGVAAAAPCSPVVVGDFVSIRKWLNTAPNREGMCPAGRVVRVWRSDSASGFMVRVRTGFLRSINLDSGWVTLI
jgi:hypothetical protein